MWKGQWKENPEKELATAHCRGHLGKIKVPIKIALASFFFFFLISIYVYFN